MKNLNDKLFDDRELKVTEQPRFDYSAVMTVANEGSVKKIDTHEIDCRTVFKQNLFYWNKETNMMSVNNFDNGYFKSLVEMGKDAVPMIYEELLKGPSPVVHALDLIFPNVVEYKGFVSLKESCNTWISILKKTGKF